MVQTRWRQVYVRREDFRTWPTTHTARSINEQAQCHMAPGNEPGDATTSRMSTVDHMARQRTAELYQAGFSTLAVSTRAYVFLIPPLTPFLVVGPCLCLHPVPRVCFSCFAVCCVLCAVCSVVSYRSMIDSCLISRPTRSGETSVVSKRRRSQHLQHKGRETCTHRHIDTSTHRHMDTWTHTNCRREMHSSTRVMLSWAVLLFL